MAFFDNIGKKVGDIAQTAVKKSGDMVETTKLNSQIRQEEESIRRQFFELGREYFNLHMSDTSVEPSLAAFIAQIKQHEQNIEGLKQRVQSLQAGPRCSACGAPANPGQAFCVSCGARITSPEPREAAPMSYQTVQCASCGSDLTPGAAFCVNCGTRIESGSPAMSEPSAQWPSSPPAPAAEPGVSFDKPEEPSSPVVQADPSMAGISSTVECPSCKTDLDSSMAFCINCGHQMK